jgi:ribosome biogenesis GTPase / thiamine phosphate phosphatase
VIDLKTYGYTEIEAIPDGSLPLERWEQYVAQQHENKYVQDKTSYLIDKRARNKMSAMQSKQTKKNGGWKK